MTGAAIGLILGIIILAIVISAFILPTLKSKNKIIDEQESCKHVSGWEGLCISISENCQEYGLIDSKNNALISEDSCPKAEKCCIPETNPLDSIRVTLLDNENKVIKKFDDNKNQLIYANEIKFRAKIDNFYQKYYPCEKIVLDVTSLSADSSPPIHKDPKECEKQTGKMSSFLVPSKNDENLVKLKQGTYKFGFSCESCENNTAAINETYFYKEYYVAITSEV